jgi:hypothetical protein
VGLVVNSSSLHRSPRPWSALGGSWDDQGSLAFRLFMPRLTGVSTMAFVEHERVNRR